jgi:hypothetical protein
MKALKKVVQTKTTTARLYVCGHYVSIKQEDYNLHGEIQATIERVVLIFSAAK